jgi:oligo-1,6-glucosidase
MKKLLYITTFLLAIVCANTSCNSAETKKEATALKDSSGKTWWKEAIVYQLYPRSFKDSDGDGIGDIKGIISKLDYLKSLGITAVWLNPIYSSPNDDNGYDVSDYRGIMKDFGTMQDFDALLKGMHERSIKLVMDIVVNHSSDEHEWFKQSRSSRISPYREYYHWWNAERGKPPYRYSLFDVNHDAWKYDSLTNAYYLHYFSRKQPDLNWENPKLRQEIYNMMKFWAAKGVDGFRLDAFQFAAKDTTWPAMPADLNTTFEKHYGMVSGIHDYLKEMNAAVFSKYDVMSVAEGAGQTFEDAHNLVDADRKELGMAYAFDGVNLAKMPTTPGGEAYSVLQFKETFTKWDSAFATNGWLAIYLSNHDQARLVSRFGNDKPEYREASSKMLNTFILSMRGTPYCYYGDEIGMTNAGFEKIEAYKDMPTLNEYQYQKNKGADMNKFMDFVQFSCRDNGRTGFQWDTTANGGFTTGTPWLTTNPNYKTINAAAQEKDANSCLNYFRKMVKLRKENAALVYGKYTLLDKNNPAVYAYTRELDGKKFLVLLNFTSKPQNVNTDVSIGQAKKIIGNYPEASEVQSKGLRPYEAIVYEVTK